MAEQDNIYASKVKYGGIFNFKDFYQFSHKWLTEVMGLDVSEVEYSEKLSGPVKNIDIIWKCTSKVSDYFAFTVKVDFKIMQLTEVEINQGGNKIRTNKGDVAIKVKGTLVKDYEGKFETSPKMKVWRGIYEKWIISQRVKQFEDKLAGDCDEFLGQVKAFLDLEGRR